jgi:hypothetical protein
MVTILRNDQDILLIPRKWWPDKTGSLEQEDPGWWYTVTEPIGESPSMKQLTPERNKEERHTLLKTPTNTHRKYYGTTPVAKPYLRGKKIMETRQTTKTRKGKHAHGEP